MCSLSRGIVQASSQKYLKERKKLNCVSLVNTEKYIYVLACITATRQEENIKLQDERFFVMNLLKSVYHIKK